MDSCIMPGITQKISHNNRNHASGQKVHSFSIFTVVCTFCTHSEPEKNSILSQVAISKVAFTLSISVSDSNAEYLALGSLTKLCTVFKVLYGTMFTLVLVKLLAKPCIAKTRMPMGR